MENTGRAAACGEMRPARWPVFRHAIVTALACSLVGAATLAVDDFAGRWAGFGFARQYAYSSWLADALENSLVNLALLFAPGAIVCGLLLTCALLILYRFTRVLRFVGAYMGIVVGYIVGNGIFFVNVAWNAEGWGDSDATTKAMWMAWTYGIVPLLGALYGWHMGVWLRERYVAQ